MASPRGEKEENRALAFGELVHTLRRRRRESLEVIGARVPMSAGNLSRLESGKQGPPSDEVIERIATALDADPVDLLRAAGRTAGEGSFEEFVRATLTMIARDVAMMKRKMMMGGSD